MHSAEKIENKMNSGALMSFKLVIVNFSDLAEIQCYSSCNI